MVLLDTNVLSEFMRRRPDQAALAWIDAQPDQSLYISAVTRAEIELGVALLPDGQRKQGLETAARRMFVEFSSRCLPFDEAAAMHYGRLVASRVRAGRPISVEDAQIAAIALAGGLALATHNIGHFAEIDRLVLIDPFAGGST